MSDEVAQANFKSQQIRDGIKNSYAASQGITLIRVPYTEKNVSKFLDENLAENGLWRLLLWLT
jgi:hypothetical protein